jgi:hypothetical protein
MIAEEKSSKNIGVSDNSLKIPRENKSRVNIDNLIAKLKKEERKDRNLSIIVTCFLLSVLAVAGFLITG